MVGGSSRAELVRKSPNVLIRLPSFFKNMKHVTSSKVSLKSLEKEMMKNGSSSSLAALQQQQQRQLKSSPSPRASSNRKIAKPDSSASLSSLNNNTNNTLNGGSNSNSSIFDSRHHDSSHHLLNDESSLATASVTNNRPMYFALKVINLHLVSGGVEKVDQLKHEVELLKTLDHRSIIKAYGTCSLQDWCDLSSPCVFSLREKRRVSSQMTAFVVENLYCCLLAFLHTETFQRKDTKQLVIVMELCTGGDLYARMPYTERQVSCAMKQVLSALSYMHDRNIIHRDIKVSSCKRSGSVFLVSPSMPFFDIFGWIFVCFSVSHQRPFSGCST